MLKPRDSFPPMRTSYLFTSESVSEGHPDKVADQISDAIVDLFLTKDPEARVACETMTTTNRVVLAGEIRGQGIMDQDGNWAPGVREEIEDAVRGVVRRIGYEQQGFHWDRFDFANHLHPQSAHIAQGVDAGENKDERHAYVKDVVARVMPQHLLGNETVYHINPTGAFEIGGPDGDAGVTGRKIIVDTYGGAAPHGGGAFSGKDPTKVDRSAAYAARYLAKNVVAAGLAERCTIQIAYAIGVAKPLSFYVATGADIHADKLAPRVRE